MPVSVVLDGPRRPVGALFRQRLSNVAGALLLVLGLLATIVALPASFVILGLIAGALDSSESSEPFPPEDFPVGLAILVWVVSVSVTVVGLRGGMRMARGERRSVLFLRRFGDDEATSVVTFVVAGRMGSRWRVVTLDDAEIVPIGVSTATRHLVGVGTRLTALAKAVGQAAIRIFPGAITVMWMIAGVQFLLVRDWQVLMEDGIVDQYVEIFVALLEFDLSVAFDAVALTLPGAFAAVGIVAAVSFVGLMAVLVVLLLAIPFAGILLFISSSTEAVRNTEASKVRPVRTAPDIEAAVRDIQAGTRKVFAPRLLVLRVATEIWQQTVLRVASVASVLLIDVSEPTEHLLWELEEVTSRFRGNFILIGDLAQIRSLSSPPSAASTGPAALLDARLRRVLEGRQVLAYTTDSAGMRRFAQALEGLFLAQVEAGTASATRSNAPSASMH